MQRVVSFGTWFSRRAGRERVLSPVLFVAVQTLNLSVVELLLALGADINLRARGGVTALMFAVDAIADFSYQSGGPLSLDLVHFLLARGADSALRDDQGETAVDVARSYGWAEAIQVLETFRPAS